MNFRYIVITLVSGMMMLGLMENNKQEIGDNKQKGKNSTKVFNICILVSSVCSFILFFICAKSPY